MFYQTMKLSPNGELEPVETKIVDQKTLTADCWLIQFAGSTKACAACEVRGTDACGGGDTLKAMLEAEGKL